MALVCLGLSGCAERITLKQALLTLDRDLAEAGVVNPEDAIVDPVTHKPKGNHQAFENAVKYQQCLYSSSNPPMAMMVTGTKLTLKGSFQDTAKGIFGWNGTAPTASLEFDTQTNQEQDIDFPVTYVSLNRLANVWQGQQLSYLSGLKDLDATRAKTAAKEITDKTTQIQSEVNDMISNEVPSEAKCKEIIANPLVVNENLY
jgi:hypothetical protein